MQFVFYYPSRDTEKKINTGNTDRFWRFAFSFNFESFRIRFTIISTCCLISIDEMEEEGGNPKFTTPIVESPFPFWKSAPPLYPHSSTRETRRRRARNSVSSTDLRTLALLSAYTPIYGPPRITNHRERKRKFSSLTRFSDPLPSNIASGLQQDFRNNKKNKERRRDIRGNNE